MVSRASFAAALGRLTSWFLDRMNFKMFVDGSQIGHPYVATGLTKLSLSFSIVLVASALVSFCPIQICFFDVHYAVSS